jgi:glycosyltransferase involved in cell wall biosynthesis
MPLFARWNLLQVTAQTVRPQFHSVVAGVPRFDCRFLEDLMDDTTLFTCMPERATTLACYTHGLEELEVRGVHLFLCLDPDAIYKRGYVAAVCKYVNSAGLDIEQGLFCLNLVDQEWITLYDDARAELRPESFTMGLGLSEDEARKVVVGAPPTFVFGRGAARAAVERAREGYIEDGYHDIFWRRALYEHGIPITQVSTAEPVFAYLRHSNNLCWGGQSVAVRQGKRPFVVSGVRTGKEISRADVTTRRRDTVDVSVVIPTYNEGAWLAKTIDSIRNAKTELRYEIVVVDDGCTDGSMREVEPGDDVRILETGGEQLGLIVAKNLGAKAARGRYLCFLDSHVVVHDHWLDYLRETCDQYPRGALVSGNLPDMSHYVSPGPFVENQFGYMIRNCQLTTGWHLYGRRRTDKPYLVPLTPGGLMFTRKAYFARLGGFDAALRKWGSEDVQISLQNYYTGGENVVDHRVVVYHHYKSDPKNGRVFSVTGSQTGFNCLHVAAAYFPRDYYLKVRQAIAPSMAGTGIAGEIESEAYQERLRNLRTEFVRGFDEWVGQFSTELRKFLKDAGERVVADGETDAETVRT